MHGTASGLESALTWLSSTARSCHRHKLMGLAGEVLQSGILSSPELVQGAACSSARVSWLVAVR